MGGSSIDQESVGWDGGVTRKRRQDSRWTRPYNVTIWWKNITNIARLPQSRAEQAGTRFPKPEVGEEQIEPPFRLPQIGTNLGEGKRRMDLRHY